MVLVHGFASGRRHFWYLERKLKQIGYQATIWRYNSFRGPLTRHSTRLREHLASLVAENDTGVHIVAHSMGTIVSRLALSETLDGFGKLVLLAPPNHGIPLARVVSNVLPTEASVAQLSSAPGGMIRQMQPNPDLVIGNIAARFDPIVPMSSTHLPHQTDHISITASHNSLLFQPSVCRLIDRFLKTERFE